MDAKDTVRAIIPRDAYRWNSAEAVSASFSGDPAVNSAAGGGNSPPACRVGFQVVQQESKALALLAESMQSIESPLSKAFARCVELVLECHGRVVVTGIGKAGIVGQKLAATLASTGTPSSFLHAAEAVHGDLGRFAQGDLAIVLSFSGETEEIVRLLPYLRQSAIPILAITSRKESTLGRSSHEALLIGSISEACPLGLAPSTSTTCMLALGDALALTVSQMRGFRAEDFARFHPGGSLGRKLSGVVDVMRKCSECRMATVNESLRQSLVRESRPGRRSGAIIIVDGDGVLTGLFTDSDLARLLERQCDQFLDHPIREVMTESPITVHQSSRLEHAVGQMVRQKISELPVVDDDHRPVGMLDITDLVELFPIEALPTDPVQVNVVSLPIASINYSQEVQSRKQAS